MLWWPIIYRRSVYCIVYMMFCCGPERDVFIKNTPKFSRTINNNTLRYQGKQFPHHGSRTKARKRTLARQIYPSPYPYPSLNPNVCPNPYPNPTLT